MSKLHRPGHPKLGVARPAKHVTPTNRHRVGESMEANKAFVFNSTALKQASDQALKETVQLKRALSDGAFTQRSSGKADSFHGSANRGKVEKVKKGAS